MPEYDFLNLSPPEFEDLSRSLLQMHLGITLESFTSGRDKGIDLRYTRTTGNEIVVQCKRYSDFGSFYNNLKKEVPKVEKLNPRRYIITTSVGLTPNQKDKIQKLFPKYIDSFGDIYGKQDLNNLLGLFPEIEKQHFKLWLSSVNILDRILHSRIYNQSAFEEDKIKDTIKVYVENESYFKSLEILKEKKYVIISGIPGIGKTTLARILVYHFLANGFKDFIFLSDSIKEAYDTFKDGVKQIFLFDDFLGRNFLERKLSNNEEQRIIKFIEKINSSKDKLLILTTREYILSQAKQSYDIFENPSLDFAKCVIDLSQYTKIVRAKILYNHLYFSGISEEYINNILEHKSYKWIIQHKNYNPRIIQTMTNPDIWKNINSNEFSDKIYEFLDYPESIWKHVFENQITPFSQCILANILSTGTPIFYDDLRLAIQNFAKDHSQKYGIRYSELEFKKAIKELENTFIISKKDDINQFTIDYQNPSVQDFLVKYFEDSPDYINDILQSAIFFNQLFRVFSVDEYEIVVGLKGTRPKILLTRESREILIKKIISEYDSLQSSQLVYANYGKNLKSRWIRAKDTEYIKLNEIIKEFLLEEYPEMKQFVTNTFAKILVPKNLDGDDFSCYLNLLYKLKDEYDFDKSLVIKKYFESITYLQQTQDFARFQTILPDEYDKFIETPENYYDRVNQLINDEVENAEDEYLDDILYDIRIAGDNFGLDNQDAMYEINKRIENKNGADDYDWDHEDYRDSVNTQSKDENTLIENMFDSLRNN